MLQILLQYFWGIDFSLSRFLSFTFKALHTFLCLFKCCLAPTTQSHLRAASNTVSCFAWTCLWRVPWDQLLTLLLSFSPLKISLLLWQTEKQENACEQSDCHNGACVSDWLRLSVVSYLSAWVISALKLSILSGEQQLLCAVSLEQRGQLVTVK